MRTPTLVVAAALAVAGCAGGAAPSTTGGATRVAPARGPMNVISPPEVEAAPADLVTAYDLVLNLRPSMLRVRGQGTSSGGGNVAVVVYQGEMRLGNVSRLTGIPRNAIHEIRYWTPTEATQRWGTGHASGAIQVIEKR